MLYRDRIHWKKEKKIAKKERRADLECQEFPVWEVEGQAAQSLGRWWGVEVLHPLGPP